MGNRFGIALSRAWTEWAAKQGVSETIAAALCLLSEKRKAEEVVDKLAPGELEQVIAVVGHQLACFPRGTLAALEESRSRSSKTSARSGPPGAGGNPYGITLTDKDLRWAAAEDIGFPAADGLGGWAGCTAGGGAAISIGFPAADGLGGWAGCTAGGGAAIWGAAATGRAGWGWTILAGRGAGW
jgi:hypothetical protein